MMLSALLENIAPAKSASLENIASLLEINKPNPVPFSDFVANFENSLGKISLCMLNTVVWNAIKHTKVTRDPENLF